MTFLESELTAREYMDERAKMVVHNFSTRYDRYEITTINGVVTDILDSSGKKVNDYNQDKALMDYIAAI